MPRRENSWKGNGVTNDHCGNVLVQRGEEVVESKFASELRDIEQAISAVDSRKHKTKTSHEKTMAGKVLYSPDALNRAFKREFQKRRWHNHRCGC